MRIIVVYKDIINKCCRSAVNPCGLIYCWSETKALKSMQKNFEHILSLSFIAEEVYVGISHYINRFT